MAFPPVAYLGECFIHLSVGVSEITRELVYLIL